LSVIGGSTLLPTCGQNGGKKYYRRYIAGGSSYSRASMHGEGKTFEHTHASQLPGATRGTPKEEFVEGGEKPTRGGKVLGSKGRQWLNRPKCANGISTIKVVVRTKGGEGK